MNLSKSLCVALVLLIGLTWAARAGGTAPAATRWEYKINRGAYSEIEAGEMLNQMGEQGWELVNVQPRDAYAGGTYIFKRAR